MARSSSNVRMWPITVCQMSHERHRTVRSSDVPVTWFYALSVAEEPIHPIYLPFTEQQLRSHFCEVGGGEGRDVDRHLKHYRKSAAAAQTHAARVGVGEAVTRADARRGRQMEKDERFWVACALMSLYYAEQGRDRAALFAKLLQRAGLPPVAGFRSWEEALSGELRLCFEVHIPSPPSYRTWLQGHLDERVPIPYMREYATTAGSQPEKASKVDAMLIAADNGVAVAFEAKVLSDASSTVSYDMLRNQIARNIDILLDPNPQTLPPLNQRLPGRSCLVLLTPEIFTDRGAVGFHGGRLYSWRMRAYQNHPVDPLLSQHLAHREPHELDGVAQRLGWATWEDCNGILPGSCPWLPVPATVQ